MTCVHITHFPWSLFRLTWQGMHWHCALVLLPQSSIACKGANSPYMVLFLSLVQMCTVFVFSYNDSSCEFTLPYYPLFLPLVSQAVKRVQVATDWSQLRAIATTTVCAHLPAYVNCRPQVERHLRARLGWIRTSPEPIRFNYMDEHMTHFHFISSIDPLS